MTGLSLHLTLGLSNLIEHRRRSGLIGAAIATITCLFVLLNALAAGVSDTLLETATTLITGDLNVIGFYKVTNSVTGVVIADYQRVIEKVEHAMPAGSYVIARGRGFGVVASENRSAQLALGGIDMKSERRFRDKLELVAGDLAPLERAHTLLIFESHARKLDVKVGDSVTISTRTLRGLYNTVDCKIAAIARDVGVLSKFTAFSSMETLRELYQLTPNTTSVLQLYLPPQQRSHLDTLAERLRGVLRDNGYRVLAPDSQASYVKFESMASADWIGQKLDVTTWQDESSFVSWTIDAFRGFSTAMMLILIAIVGAGIMNTLWIAIRERTREIGSLRAIGMQRTSVVSMFLVEAGLLGGLASSVGMLLGVVLAELTNAANLSMPESVQLFLMRDTLVLSIEPLALALAVVSITFITGLAALLPSLRAARLRPVAAMSHIA